MFALCYVVFSESASPLKQVDYLEGLPRQCHTEESTSSSAMSFGRHLQITLRRSGFPSHKVASIFLLFLFTDTRVSTSMLNINNEKTNYDCKKPILQICVTKRKKKKGLKQSAEHQHDWICKSCLVIGSINSVTHTPCSWKTWQNLHTGWPNHKQCTSRDKRSGWLNIPVAGIKNLGDWPIYPKTKSINVIASGSHLNFLHQM